MRTVNIKRALIVIYLEHAIHFDECFCQLGIFLGDGPVPDGDGHQQDHQRHHEVEGTPAGTILLKSHCFRNFKCMQLKIGIQSLITIRCAGCLRVRRVTSFPFLTSVRAVKVKTLGSRFQQSARQPAMQTVSVLEYVLKMTALSANPTNVGTHV